MPFPVFFSVAGPDVAFAENIWDTYRDDLIYLYSRAGEAGANFIAEERAELPQARAVVVFWSAHYLANEGTRRELAIAAQLIASGVLKSVCVLRLDGTPFTASEGVNDPDQLKVFRDLATIISEWRLSPPHVDPQLAAGMIDRVVREAAQDDLPFLERGDVSAAFQARIKSDRFHYYPCVWLSGLHGYGRKTMIAEVCRSIQNPPQILEIDVSEFSLPQQLLFDLENKGLGTPVADLAARASDPETQTPAALATLIEKLSASGRFVICRQARVIDDRAAPPEWLLETIKLLKPGNRPKLFLVAQVRPDDTDLIASENKLRAFGMPAMSEEETERLAEMLVGALDDEPARWTDDKLQQLAKTAGGNPDLLIAITKQMVALRDLDTMSAELSKIASNSAFADRFTQLINLAMRKVRGSADALLCERVLLFLNDIGQATAADIAVFLGSPSPISKVLNFLEQYALVERTGTDAYRITPLLSKRLSSELTHSEVRADHDAAMRAFAQSPLRVEAGDYGMIEVSARIQAGLWTGVEDNIAVRAFVSAAYRLQAGVRLYHARHYPEALRQLDLAFAERASFDLTAQFECARYLGLTAVRLKKQDKLDQALMLLRSRHQGKQVANYIQAEQKRFAGDHRGAIELYEKALTEAADKHETRREERILRPLIDCLLHERRFQQAITYANRMNGGASAPNSGAGRRTHAPTKFSLMKMAQTRLHYYYKDQSVGSLDEEGQNAVWDEYVEWLDILEQHPGCRSQYLQICAEEAFFENRYHEGANFLDDPSHDGRIEILIRKWRYLLLANRADLSRQVRDEIARARYDKSQRLLFMSLLDQTLLLYARALHYLGELGIQKLDQIWPSGTGGLNVDIIRKARNDHQWLRQAEASED